MLSNAINRLLRRAVPALLVVGATVFALGGCGSDSTPSGPAETTEVAPGQAVYAELCSSCHGSQGNGGPGGALNNAELSVDEVMDIAANGRGRMGAIGGGLSQEDLRAVAEWTVELTAEN